jgi:hypothetical protein
LLDDSPVKTSDECLRILQALIEEMGLKGKVIPFAHNRVFKSLTIPEQVVCRILGFLLGYSPEEIQKFDRKAQKHDREEKRAKKAS